MFFDIGYLINGVEFIFVDSLAKCFRSLSNMLGSCLIFGLCFIFQGPEHYSKPRDSKQRHKVLDEAQKDYAKPHKKHTKPPKDYTKL